MDSPGRKFWENPTVFNRKTRRLFGFTGHGALAPIDLGIKQYKREHSNDRKRVLYYKQQMWKAFHELKEKNDG